jgi:hypothetical protein
MFDIFRNRDRSSETEEPAQENSYISAQSYQNKTYVSSQVRTSIYSLKTGIMYQVLDIQSEKAILTDPMDKLTLENFVVRKYLDQPLRYFNEGRSLWVINLETRDIRPLSVRVEV